jgi:DNA-binding IclR family transcriptional regulator
VIPDESAGGRTVISKAVTILMTYLGGASHSLTEIAAITGLPLSTAHRLLYDMASCKLLERANNGEYRIGFSLRVIGAAARGAPPIWRSRHISFCKIFRTSSTPT